MSAESEHNAAVLDRPEPEVEAYSRLIASMPTERSARFRALVQPRHTDRVIDVACGPGVLSLGLAPHVTEVVGLHVTPKMLKDAQKLQGAAKLWNIRWVIGDAASLPFGDDTFSLVICSGSFHHFDDPVTVLEEMVRVCGATGRIAINDVTPSGDKCAAYNQLETWRDPSHCYAYSIDELRALGRRAGLREVHVDTSYTGDIPFEAVLATSDPVERSRGEIHALLAEDARSGEDHYGFKAHFVGDTLMASFTTTTFVWQPA